MFWSIGVISNLYPSSKIKIPCSAYSLSMDLAIAVNFWDAGPEAIGEDCHMYLKCFFATQGRLITVPVFSPVSQCNVQDDRSYVSGMKARYSQAKRHLWGSLDTGYAIRNVCSLYSKRFYGNVSKLKNSAKNGMTESLNLPHWCVFLQLLHRLLEAHILMGHLTLLIITGSCILPVKASFSFFFATKLWTMISDHPISFTVQVALVVSFWLRISCLIPNVIMLNFYEKYYQWNGFDRWELQGQIIKIEGSTFGYRVNHLGKRPLLESRRSGRLFIMDWLVVPISCLSFMLRSCIFLQIDCTIKSLQNQLSVVLYFLYTTKRSNDIERIRPTWMIQVVSTDPFKIKSGHQMPCICKIWPEMTNIKE